MKVLFASITASALLFANAAQAAVGYIVDADVEKGEFELEYQLVNQFDDTQSRDHKRSHSLEGNYGLTDAFLIGGGFKVGRSSLDDSDLETLFIESVYQFIDADDYGFDMALLGEYVYAVEDHKADKLEAKLLYENEWGEHFETRFNLIYEQQIGHNSNTSPKFVSRFSTVYELNDYINPGIEWHAGYGHLNNMGGFDKQEHYVGPAAYGELFEFGEHGGEIEYELSYVFGVSDAAADGALRFLLEYEVEF
jgi:hypothetical protein